jgi:tryptophanyl-tRNA synthetase
VLTVPEGRIESRVAIVPGTDGRKMSKSYGNVVPIFADRSEIERRVKRIVTDSRRADEPKDPDACNVFALYRLVATTTAAAELAGRYRSGSVSYHEAKQLLVAAHEERFGTARDRYRELINDRASLRSVLREGAQRARPAARELLDRARDAVGMITTAANGRA